MMPTFGKVLELKLEKKESVNWMRRQCCSSLAQLGMLSRWDAAFEFAK